ncbi:hypothetical protein [Vibrio sp. WXL210]|uniref:hypothetical protein n=1 Tax=Vibrio sp. WXL210 TaxID=3450709 RepID=UPI003EC7ED96
MSKCNHQCKNYNADSGTCSLIDRHTHIELDALMNSSPENLAHFLLHNDCEGDFASMYQKSTTHTSEYQKPKVPQ